MKRETVIVLDFGGQYNQLIARRVRECNVYCEIYSYKTDIEKIKEIQPKGIIFTGGPNSAYLPDSPTYTKEIFELGIPILGICYGSQLMMHLLGGKVEVAPVREYGKIEVTVDTSSALFENVSEKTICWMSHNDYISKAAPGFEIIAHTDDCPVAAVANVEKNLYATQFHPEVLHTKEGKKMLSNFVYNVCHCAGDWHMDSFVEESIKAIREKVGDGKVLCALSGGVDSSVAAVMLSKAVGNQLTCVFVDHGLLRKNEGDEVEAVVLTLDREERKMSLGIKQLKQDPWETIEEKYPVGSKHTAKVRNFTNFGVFVEIEEGVDGLIHISDLSWTKKVKHPSEFTQIGADIEVQVLEIDKENRRLSLGHKQLEENPWDVFETVFTVGSVHEGTIIEMLDKGAVVALPYGVEGFATPKHLVKEDGSQAQMDEKLSFKVIEFNKDAKRIILSHSRIFEDEQKGAKKETGEKKSSSKRGGKKEEESAMVTGPVEKTTLGDIEELAALKEKLAGK